MIRPYKITKDSLALMRILEAEGVKREAHRYIEYPTYVYDDGGIQGFFTFRMEQGFPALIHFCTDREHRSPALARKLIKAFVEKVKEGNFVGAIIHVKQGKGYLDKFVQYYFKKKPYATKDGFNFYFVKV